MIALVLAAVACAPAFASDAQWEQAAPAWVAAFSRAPFLQQRADFVRMSTDRKLDVAEWLPLLPGATDVRWRRWYADLGDLAVPLLFERMREERDERGLASLVEVVVQLAAARPGWRPTPPQRDAMARASASMCDAARRSRAAEVLQAFRD